jgi:hypothetical protein
VSRATSIIVIASPGGPSTPSVSVPTIPTRRAASSRGIRS